MIQLKNPLQIREMREAGRITGEALLVARENIREGITRIREYMKTWYA
jgi:Xaa-Pro aminopeptidase